MPDDAAASNRRDRAPARRARRRAAPCIPPRRMVCRRVRRSRGSRRRRAARDRWCGSTRRRRAAAARTSSRPDLVGAERRAATPGRRRAARIRRAPDPRSPASPTPNSRWSARFQPATPPPNSVAAYDVSTGTPYFVGERVGDVGIERRGARHHRPHAGEIGGVEVGVEHHPERGRHQADGLGPVPTHRVDPTVDGEALEQRDAATVEHRLQHAEQPAEVHERRVDDDDASAELQRRCPGSTRSAWLPA